MTLATAPKLALKLGFWAVVFFVASASAQSILPVPQLLQQISQLEAQIQEERIKSEEEEYGPESPWGWDADAFPEATRSWMLYDIPESTLEQIEQNKDQNGKELL